MRDARHNWRIIYRIGALEIDVVDVFAKTTEETPASVIEGCKNRLKKHDQTR